VGPGSFHDLIVSGESEGLVKKRKGFCEAPFRVSPCDPVAARTRVEAGNFSLPRSPVVKFTGFMMRRPLESKRWKFLLSCAALIALVLLAMGLQNVNFKPAQSVEVGSQQETDFGLPPDALPLDQVIIVITILTFFFIGFCGSNWTHSIGFVVSPKLSHSLL
jgi:hypothetical protein